jgi:hypothetical protein
MAERSWENESLMVTWIPMRELRLESAELAPSRRRQSHCLLGRMED